MKKLFLILLLSGLFFAFVAFALSDGVLTYLFNLIMGLSTNIWGMIVTIFLVQKYIDDIGAKSRKLAEANKILRYDRIMRQYIRQYLKGYASIAVSDKQNVESITIDPSEDDNFEFSDMAGMYECSLMIAEKGVRPSIEIYYENEEKLAKYAMKMIENVDFESCPQILNILINLYGAYIESDEKDMVLWPLKIENPEGRKNLTHAMVDMIKDKKMDWVAQNERGELEGNVMKSFVALYHKTRKERKLIAEYVKEVEKLRGVKA